jgi:hypothetical protein
MHGEGEGETIRASKSMRVTMDEIRGDASQPLEPAEPNVKQECRPASQLPQDAFGFSSDSSAVDDSTRKRLRSPCRSFASAPNS